VFLLAVRSRDDGQKDLKTRQGSLVKGGYSWGNRGGVPPGKLVNKHIRIRVSHRETLEAKRRVDGVGKKEKKGGWEDGSTG